jgi:Restriction endonuclease
MRLRVFGRNSDDKGTQLERLTRRLLQKIGYTDVTLNIIGSGGSEIDVRAKYSVPGLHGTSSILLLGECKAYDSPINLPDWLKFLGKIYSEKARRSNQVNGVLVALSGANGNVIGAFEEFREFDKTVELITGERLAELCIEEFNLPTIGQARDYVAKLTTDPVTEYSLGYYAEQLCWIVEFASSTFTLLCGTELDQVPETFLAAADVSTQLRAASYRNLGLEEEGRRRSMTARKYVLSRATSAGGCALDSEELADLSGLQITEPEVREAVLALVSDGLVVTNERVTTINGTETDLDQRIAVLRELTDGFILLNSFGTPAWLRLIDDTLLGAILDIQGSLDMSTECRRECLHLLRWSPTAVSWALRPDPMIVKHRETRPGQREPGTIDEDDVRYFRLQLLRYAVADFQNPTLATVYFEKLGLRELEFSRHAAFKSDKAVELSISVSERLGIARAAPELGGGVLRIWMLSQAPEPWELMGARSADSNVGREAG